MTFDTFQSLFARLEAHIGRVVVGQSELVFGLVTGVIAGGHLLLEGAPGLGKTLAARVLAQSTGAVFKRIQFTPDLMPGDVTGSSIYDKQSGTFTFVPGPLFTQILLADEINRAPAKTQSALLEAMQEGQVTVDGVSHALPEPFVVLATQNPVESHGTYPLPEAQLDRFLLKLLVPDPSKEAEERIVRAHADGFEPRDLSSVVAVTTPEELRAATALARTVRVDDRVVRYLVELVRASRADRAVELGASPRAAVALLRASQVVAASQGRGFVTPDDVKPIARAVLRHRLVLHPDAEIQGATPDSCVERILESVPVPRLDAAAS